MSVYYNEIESYPCAVLRKQIAAGNLPKGFVDERDIRNVQSDELAGYTQIHLFAGVGAFALGLKWAGFPENIRIITGGFPCQDVSVAGTNGGLDGERSGLWREYFRVIRDLRPDLVIVENSSALLSRGGGRVLGDLASIGYDAEWETLQARMFGAPHERSRLFVVAYPDSFNGKTGLGAFSNGARKIFTDGNRQRFPIWLQAADQFIGMDDGISAGIYRNRGIAIGNAVVPQIVEFIGRAIIELENQIAKEQYEETDT